MTIQILLDADQPRLMGPNQVIRLLPADEDQLLAIGVTYVFIGNLLVHQHKPILTVPHRCNCRFSGAVPANHHTIVS